MYYINEKIKNKKLLSRLMFLGVFGLIVLGVFWMGQSLSNRKSEATGTIVENFMPKDNDTVMLVEFSDFQCPACRAYYPLAKQIKEEFGGELIFVYKNFPLKSIHKNAELAARAGESARLQDKFSEMEEALFTNQDEWANSGDADELFVSYAGSIGLDIKKFSEDIESDQVRDKVDSDYMEGMQLGIRGTPTFFINGQKITNPTTYDGFKKLIQDALEQ